MSEPLLFVLLVLAAYRATRLATTDSITDSLRTAWYLRFPPIDSPRGPAHPLGQLVDCPWCVGFWITGAAWAIVWAVHDLNLPGLWWPAAATTVGLIGKVDG